MKYLQLICWIGLAIYSVALIGIESQTDQDTVRHFFSDIEGQEGVAPFFAVNTTISVALLWGTALLFAVCLYCETAYPRSRKLLAFYASQLAVFAFLGFDDRFLFHERVAFRIGIGDHYILLTVAVFELVCLGWLGRQLIKGAVAFNLFAAGFLFVVMIVIDALFPHEMALRLSLEDLAKTWGTFFFFLFAWEILKREIDGLAARQGAPG